MFSDIFDNNTRTRTYVSAPAFILIKTTTNFVFGLCLFEE